MITRAVADKAITVRIDSATKEMATSQYISDQEILAKLMEIEHEANDPNTKWLSHEEVFTPLREKFKYEVHH